MKKIVSKRLELTRETVRALADRQLEPVAAGALVITSGKKDGVGGYGYCPDSGACYQPMRPF